MIFTVQTDFFFQLGDLLRILQCVCAKRLWRFSVRSMLGTLLICWKCYCGYFCLCAKRLWHLSHREMLGTLFALIRIVIVIVKYPNAGKWILLPMVISLKTVRRMETCTVLLICFFVVVVFCFFIIFKRSCCSFMFKTFCNQEPNHKVKDPLGCSRNKQS